MQISIDLRRSMDRTRKKDGNNDESEEWDDIYGEIPKMDVESNITICMHAMNILKIVWAFRNYVSCYDI